MFRSLSRQFRLPVSCATAIVAVPARKFAAIAAVPVKLGTSYFLLTVILAACLPSIAYAVEGVTLVEPATGITFVETMNGSPLLGTGCRYKWGLVKVYAVGIYASNAQQCVATGDAFKGLVESAEPKTVVIKMAMTIDAPKVFC
jgi:hypothetical protein